MLLHVPQDVTATSADSTTQVWPYCAHGSGADGVGCRGRIVEPHTVCLAHLTDADRSAYLAGLQPGVDLDHRGTSFTEELLSELLAALTDPATDEPHLGNAVFDTARFSGDAHFDGAKSNGNVLFHSTVFERTAQVGPLVCAGTQDVSEAVFHGAVTIEASTAALQCRRTRWASTGPYRCRPDRLPLRRDQLRLEDRCLLATTPSGLRWRGVRPVRCTPRQTLAEEHHWRATRTHGVDGWVPAPEGEAVLAMMLWGLPQDDPKPQSTGTLTGRTIAMTTYTPDPART